MECSSQVGELLQALIQYHYSFGYLFCQYSFWLFGFSWKLFPLRRSMVCVCKLIEKKSKKNILKKRKKTGKEQGGTKDSGTVFFAGGWFFYF